MDKCIFQMYLDTVSCSQVTVASVNCIDTVDSTPSIQQGKAFQHVPVWGSVDKMIGRRFHKSDLMLNVNKPLVTEDYSIRFQGEQNVVSEAFDVNI